LDRDSISHGQGLEEVALSGGTSTPGVVRVGDTVRRPIMADAEYTQRLLVHLEGCGFAGAPRYLGVDERGRTILSYIDGFAPPHSRFRLTEDAVRAGAKLVRAVHDLTEDTPFAAGSEIASHPNLSQPNFVFRDMIPIAIIDWDGTSPGTRVAISASSCGRSSTQPSTATVSLPRACCAAPSTNTAAQEQAWWTRCWTRTKVCRGQP
jgi:hypothetical protein